MDFDLTQYLPFIDKCFSPNEYLLSEVAGGLSDDVKLKAVTDGGSYIVKIVEGKRRKTPENEKRLVWYRALCRANEEDERIVCPKWFDFIDNHVVTVTEWVPGISLEEYLYKNPDEQIKYGKEFGRLLYKIHNFDFVKEGIANSGERFAPKTIKRVDDLLDCVERLGITFTGIEKVTEYLRENKDVISEDRMGILHDDIRLENVIINGGNISLFDFDSGTIGDCYGDFAYLTALADKDFKVFAYAVIMAYFDGKVPDGFWKVNLYFCMIKLLEYAVFKFNKCGKMIVKQAESCKKIFRDYEEVIPDWWGIPDGQYRKKFIVED